jgi:BED zinc finger
MKHRSKIDRSVDSGGLQIQTQATTSGRDESLLTWDPVYSRQYEICAMNDGLEMPGQECMGSACDVVTDTAGDSTPAGEAESSSGQSALLALHSPPSHSSGGDEFTIYSGATRSATAAAIRSHFLWSKCHTRFRCRHCFAIGSSGNGITNSRKHLSRRPAVNGKRAAFEAFESISSFSDEKQYPIASHPMQIDTLLQKIGQEPYKPESESYRRHRAL